MATEEARSFEFVSEEYSHGELSVVALTAEEEMNGEHRLRAELSCAADAALLGDLEGSLLGKFAAITITAGEILRRLHGAVISYRLAGFDAHRARVHVEIVPRFALMKLSRRSRIFQDRSVREVVEAVLGEWKIAHEFQIGAGHVARPFCTQHGESDYDFVARILAAEGIGFYLAAASPRGSVKEAPAVIFFDAATYPDVPGPENRLPGGRKREKTVLRHAHSNFEHRADDILDFSLRRGLAHRSAVLGDFDFRRPQLGMEARSSFDQNPAVAPAPIERNAPMEAYFYADRQEREGSSTGAEIDGDLAQATLEQLRRDAWIGTGHTRSGRLVPGHVFTLEGHPIDALNQDYVVTRVEHTGHGPQTGIDETYTARFECVPAGVVHRPPVERGFRRVHGAETATVVGPDGEQVYTDSFGRVKVRFHWDREGKGDEHSSCWLRVAEAWAGQRYGVQFIPRVGMEVLVTFLGGDVDRPVVTGCLYNTTHPAPFRLPSDRHRSGIRTQSSDDSGYNEISFQDRAGEEQVLVQAQRDLDFSVGRDHSVEVERHETHRVSGSRTLSVDGAETATVGGNRTESVGGAHVQRIKGDRTVQVDGDRTDDVGGDLNSTVHGSRTSRVAGDAREEIAGRAELALKDDAVLRTDGHLVFVVGQHDARKSATIHVEGGSELYATGVTEIVAEKGIVLRVGKSSIRIHDDAIEIAADTFIVRSKEVYALADEKMKLIAKKEALLKSDKKVFLQAENGSLQLTRDARVDGDVVKLNCSPEPVDDEVPDEKKIETTKFSLVDDKGKPMGDQRLVLIMPDGSERNAVLDQDGKAELELDDSGKILFPDVSSPEPA